jgi:DNA polymerase III subunit epsilon
MRQIVLDTETTGLSAEAGHRIIEIGAVELINRKLTGKTFHYYLNPEREIESEALAIHGITNNFLKDKPKFAEIAQAFYKFIQDAEWIIHNALFDLGFLNREFKLIDFEIKLETRGEIIDTLVMARKLHPGQRNSLDALCKRYKIDNTNRKLHGALLDAELLARVYLAMTSGQSSLFGEEEIQNATSLNKIEYSHPLVIVKPTEVELTAHEAMMKLVHKKRKTA